MDSLVIAINNACQIAGNSGGHVFLWNTRRPATPAEEVSILTSKVNTLLANHVLRFSDAQPLSTCWRIRPSR